MNLKSVSGRLAQMRRMPPGGWGVFVGGWLTRHKNQCVPCLLPGCQQLLKVPMREFYESYAFFCEHPLGLAELGFFMERLQPGDVFYDVGGFRAAYSASVKMKLGNHASIHIFEPVSQNIEVIRRIAALNQFANFKINPIAVGDGEPVAGGINEQDVMLRLGDVSVSGNAVKFPSITVDQYIADGNPPPSVVKIDVDGFELHVLRGAQNCLARQRPRLWIEVHPAFLSAQKKSADDVLQFLRGCGYRISFFDDFSSPDAKISYHIWCE